MNTDTKTYWVRLSMDPDESINLWDAWTSGYSDDSKIVCFALRADSEEQLFEFLNAQIVEPFDIDFCEERSWKVYRDFAGPGTRWPLAEKFLDDPIDHISKWSKADPR